MQTQDPVAQDDRAPVQTNPYASKLKPTVVHRAADWLADRAVAGYFEARLAGSMITRGLVKTAKGLGQAVNPYYHARQLAQARAEKRGCEVANALATLGIPSAEYAMLLYSQNCLTQWEGARKTLKALDRVDIGDMPRDWPLSRAIEDGKPWLRDILGNQFDGTTIDNPPQEADPVQSEADAIAADLAKQGYSVAESFPDADGSVRVLTDAPEDVVQQAAVSAAIVQDAIIAEDVGPAPGTEPQVASPLPAMQQQGQRERLFPSATPKGGVAQAAQSPSAGADDARAVAAGLVTALSPAIAETAGQAALREIGPECATLAVGEIARELGSPVIVADTPDGGASIAPVTAQGIADTARAMGDSAAIVAGIAPLHVDNSPAPRMGSGEVSAAAVTMAAGEFALRPSPETAATWRRIAKQAKNSGAITPEELTRTRVATADYIPHTGQGALRGSSKRK